MADEAGTKLGDLAPVAELVDCAPEAPTDLSVDASAPDTSPVQQAMEATLGQTGADPPPRGDH